MYKVIIFKSKVAKWKQIKLDVSKVYISLNFLILFIRTTRMKNYF